MEIDGKKTAIILGLACVIVGAIYYFALRTPGNREGKKFDISLSANSSFKKKPRGMPSGWTPGNPQAVQNPAATPRYTPDEKPK
jgi:hypothetical protein